MFKDVLTYTTDMLGGFVPSLLGALGILVVGWIAAVAVRSIVRGALRRTRCDERVAQWTTAEPVSGEQHAGTVIYWVIMLFVAVEVFQALNLPLVAQPLNALLSQVANFVPQLAGAALLLVVAWIVATLLRRVVGGGLRARSSSTSDLGVTATETRPRRPSPIVSERRFTGSSSCCFFPPSSVP